MSWSMGELLARVAQPQDEGRWLEAARSRTVRQMRALVRERTFDQAGSGGVASAGPGGSAGSAEHGGEHEVGHWDARCADESVHRFNRSAQGNGTGASRGAQGNGTGASRSAQGNGTGASRSSHEGGSGSGDGIGSGDGNDDDEMCSLTCTVDREDAWLFEATRTLLGHLGTHGNDAQLEALLAEGQGALLAALPLAELDLGGLERVGEERLRWLAELRRWRDEAEAVCEGHCLSASQRVAEAEPVQHAVATAAALGFASLEGASGHELDGAVRGLSEALARHELDLSVEVLRFHRAGTGGGWRELGYATEAQYARERLGMSRSSLVARRALALRLERLPLVAEALGAGKLGVEAALQVVRVAASSTQAAWVERARRRTVKHLREEVAAALVAVRLSGEACCPPPLEVEMVAFHALEQAVVSGRAFQEPAANDTRVTPGAGACGRKVAGAVPSGEAVCLEHHSCAEAGSEERHAWRVMLASLSRWLEGGLQLSAACSESGASRAGVSRAGRVVLRLRLSRDTCDWWRGLEARARRWLPRGMSWLRFLCLSVWRAWRHVLGADVAYGRVYVRDRYRCMSPVCSRRDVTPHHLQFRSAGGSDSDDNVASVCTWCHLFGVHGGRIRAVGRADRIRWELGAPGRPCVVVQGRERVAA